MDKYTIVNLKEIEDSVSAHVPEIEGASAAGTSAPSIWASATRPCSTRSKSAGSVRAESSRLQPRSRHVSFTC